MCVCAYKKTCKYVSYTAWDKANVYMLLSQTQKNIHIEFIHNKDILN